MSKKLAVFDFDHTVIDANSDTVVRDLIPPEEIPSTVKQLYTSDGWTAYMQGIFELLEKKDINESKIKTTIEAIPPLDGMDKLLRELVQQRNYDVIIVSDSNSYFIDTWLRKYNLEEYVTSVFTNPAKFLDGLLKIEMYHLQTECSLSTRNLCKGRIMQEFIKSQKQKNIFYDRVIYAGDGYNDFCPILRLNTDDLACVREKYKCAELVKSTLDHKPIDNTGLIYKLNCDTLFWNNGDDILNKLQ